MKGKIFKAVGTLMDNCESGECWHIQGTERRSVAGIEAETGNVGRDEF